MELEKIIKLIDAGYTKADIEVMTATPAPVQEPEKEPDPEPKPEATGPKHAPKTSASEPPVVSNEDILTAMNRLTQALVSKNLNMTTAETMKDRTTNDILAEIIAPPRKDKNA